MKKIIEKYKKYLLVNESSYSTITSYTQKVDYFLNQVKLEDISTETIQDYLLKQREKLLPSTLNLYKSALKSFLNFLEKDNIKMPKSAKLPKIPPEFITLKYFENDIIPMVEVICDKVLKYKTILYFMFYSGLRVGDVASLHRNNFDLEKKIVKVYIKKGKKEITIPYPKKVKDILEQYFSIEEEIKGAFNIKKAGIQAIFKKLNPYFEKINFHPHLLRHSGATHWRKKGIKIEDVQYLLAHENIQSTMIYSHADKEVIIENFHKMVK